MPKGRRVIITGGRIIRRAVLIVELSPVNFIVIIQKKEYLPTGKPNDGIIILYETYESYELRIKNELTMALSLSVLIIKFSPGKRASTIQFMSLSNQI